MTTTAPTVTLSHGTEMPVLGLGTAGFDDAEAAECVRTAIEDGYRLVDTAENYGNERGVGQGIRDAAVPREELFVTTKFNKRWHSVDGARQACENSLERLGLEYVDLLLIHWPNPGQNRYVEAWEGMIRLREEGLARAIGVSNFKPHHLDRLVEATGVTPEVNQINLNPYATRASTHAYHVSHGIVTEAWSPLQPATMLQDPVITEIAARTGCSPAQAVLRWLTQRGIVTVPRSGSREHRRQNLASVDVQLTQKDIDDISALDRGEDHVTDSDEFGH
ncbi:aldo/keto reductase [Isoptericola variabilis]|uniref:2,5-didehydrogluconate reductase n=1 Tax=Isoptericola variabilis (strain 225) TaxID=743718 RepID=F6FS62_ISOV2|nr:aldo/keto reductase [Isoptericola variabilis]AEG45159.1 2,5-didehydrogluconate reductase [Isoptericola variabilis 225]TWH31451.1 2,5-diketo-D-gluconate reductase A [Isoptericola variabilis J7]